MASINKVRIIVVGDSGVGKTSLVHLIATGDVIKRAAWTVGCSVEVKLHEYKQATLDQKTFFVELWDTGGSQNHKKARQVFFKNIHGVILVHDLTNRNSELNLKEWLCEIHRKNNADSISNESAKYFNTNFDVDPEFLVGFNQIPILILGTKTDLMTEDKLRKRSKTFANQCGAEEILVSCSQAKSFCPGSTNAVKLSKFFDKVIERRFYVRNTNDFKEKRWPDQNVFHID